MNPQTTPTIPCHLIAGPLGVGKTTAIIDYLKRHRHGQFVAVLVNDFGPIGLDGAIIGADAGGDEGRKLSVFNVPGGCVCCSAADGLVAGFAKIAKLPRLDRIIIEPSGVAMPGEIVELIAQLRLPFAMEMRPTVVIVDPGDVAGLDDPATPAVPYFEKMIEAADVLVANRCDKASAQTMAKFHAFAAAIYPPKLRVVTTTRGVLPDEVFELRAKSEEAPRYFSAVKQTHEVTQRADGTTWPAELEFRLDALLPRVKAMAQHGVNGAKIERLKAVFHTDQGWKLIEIARGEVHCNATAYRRDNRIDWITSGGAIGVDVMRGRMIEAVKQPVF
jgi:G3E family GTPase